VKVMKAEFTTPELRRRQRQGYDVFPVFGRPLNMPRLDYSPRTKFDPKPWVWGEHATGFRYSSAELTTEPHVATPAELIDQRHRFVEDHDALDIAFSHLADRIGTKEEVTD
jgi:hypothetical protein